MLNKNNFTSLQKIIEIKMKTKFLITATLLLTFLSSCKNETKKPEKLIENKFFFVEVEASAMKTDDFAMYYSEDGTSVFKDINAVWHGIVGGNKFQKIQFKLSDEKFPTHIRLDFGLKQNQDSVVIKNVKVSYYDNVFEFRGSDFFKYFIANDQFATSIDNQTGAMTIVKKDGVYKTPYYYPTTATIDGIKKITATKTIK